MLTAFTALLLCQLIGEGAVRALDLPIPGPVAGMALLFAALVAYGEVPEALDRVGRTLLAHLSLLFVPAGVGVITHLGRISGEPWALLLALGPATLIALVVTGWVMAKLAPADGER
ncbi:MAG: CidA/LrgA family protein [Alphaproteobacteria bacterium]|jgi:holin-like protein|nr:CidA/LrgA family protein [Alphaproteobacteria bacterium]